MSLSAISEAINLAVEQLLGRSSGPLHFRLILQPVTSTILAILAGIRDAKSGDPAFLWTVLTEKAERRIEVQSGWRDIGKVVILATILDVTYQGFVLHGFFPVQTLVVVLAVAVLPYIVLRGPVARIARMLVRSGRGRSQRKTDIEPAPEVDRDRLGQGTP